MDHKGLHLNGPSLRSNGLRRECARSPQSGRPPARWRSVRDGRSGPRCTLERVPIVHLHGGEVTSGAIDDATRNAITELSHLHLVSHQEHADRVIALGEAAETVYVVGAPGLDNIHRTDLPSRAELEHRLGHDLRPPVVVVTLHPTTLASAEQADAELEVITAAMAAVDATYVVTLPNNDPGHEPIRTTLAAAARDVDGVAVEALGDRCTGGAQDGQRDARNSSSAIVEAPIVRLPAVTWATASAVAYAART